MISDVMPEGETVRVGGYPLTYVRRLGGLVHTFVLDKTDEGEPRLQLAVQPLHATSERLVIAQTMLLTGDQLAELAAAALALKAEITARHLTTQTPPGPNPGDTGS